MPSLEIEGVPSMELDATQASDRPEARAAGLRFAYPGGSRPLDGYTIKRGIGRGGFGEVYYAVSDGGKEVALKLIRRNLDVELRGVSHCLNLKHPNLLGLYDIRQDDTGDTWIVMEYVSGGSLEDVIARCPNGVPPADVMKWLAGIAGGVAYLHDHGIVHRDLKPGNIFLDEGIVKIGDYGLSKFISASRRSGQTESVGTVHYMAPEVANGRYGKEIDVYAMGIILFEMITGRVPFEGESVGEVLMKHLTAEPDLSALQEPYRACVGRALDKDPERRVQTVAAFLNILGGLPAGGAFTQPLRVDPSPAAQPVAAMKVPVPLAEPMEEPIWKAVREALQNAKTAWDRAPLNKPSRIALMVLGAIGLVYSFQYWLPWVFPAALIYGVYRVIWTVVGPGRHRPLLPPPVGRPPGPQGVMQAHLAQGAPPVVVVQAGEPVTVAEVVSPPRRERVKKPAEPVRAMPVKSGRQQVTELLGSLLLSAIVASVASVLIVLARGVEPRTEEFLWLGIVSTLAAWGVLIPSKFWEGTDGEPIFRRLTLGLVAAGVGIVAWFLSRELLVSLRFELSDPHGPWPRPTDVPYFFGTAGDPMIWSFVPYFAFLFLVPKWWKQTNPLRSSRLSLWSVILIVLWAGILSAPWPFPQPWGIGLAAATSLAVQVASPWMDPRLPARV
jgi:hypothetical protein